MRLEISTFKNEIVLYNTKEEWDGNQYSVKSYDEEWLKKNIESSPSVRRSTFSANQLMVARTEPTRYPCLALKGKVTDTVYGPITVDYIFIYNFKIVE